MNDDHSPAVNIARDYYNSEDADRFYFMIWGGEDIHIGLYETVSDAIADASRRTVQQMSSRLGQIGPQSRVLDMGAGYGGAARFLAETFGCRVTALNLSAVENARNRQLNAEQNLDGLIDVVEGNFESLPFEDQSFDVVWSQDAFLHGGRREAVFAEAARVMKPGADLIFTDPMRADDCPDGVLQPILDRIHLSTLGSPAFYQDMADRCGLRNFCFEDLSAHLPTHYARVLAEMQARETELKQHVSEEYLVKMKQGLQHWIDGGRRGYLSWGIFHIRR